MSEAKKCESCGKKMPPYSDDDLCEDCWEDGDTDTDQLLTCALCGAEVFDHHEICDGCREDEKETDF